MLLVILTYIPFLKSEQSSPSSCVILTIRLGKSRCCSYFSFSLIVIVCPMISNLFWGLYTWDLTLGLATILSWNQYDLCCDIFHDHHVSPNSNNNHLFHVLVIDKEHSMLFQVLVITCSHLYLFLCILNFLFALDSFSSPWILVSRMLTFLPFKIKWSSSCCSIILRLVFYCKSC